MATKESAPRPRILLAKSFIDSHDALALRDARIEVVPVAAGMNSAGCRLGRVRYSGSPAATSSREGKNNVTQ